MCSSKLIMNVRQITIALHVQFQVNYECPIDNDCSPCAAKAKQLEVNYECPPDNDCSPYVQFQVNYECPIDNDCSPCAAPS